MGGRSMKGTSRFGIDDLIGVVSCIALLLMCVLSLSYDNRAYEIATGVFCGLFCLVPMLMKHLNVIRLPTDFVLMIIAAIAFHAFGVLFLSYDYLAHYDTLTHTLSSIVVAFCVYYTLLCYQAYSSSVRLTPGSLSLTVALIMFGFTAYWEVFEYIVDILTSTNMQYSPFDTIRDLLCNSLGSITVSLYAAVRSSNMDPKTVVERFQLNPRLMKFISDPFGEGRGDNS